jgi:RNA polymerase sigma-70 factor (ECF subfamily)
MKWMWNVGTATASSSEKAEHAGEADETESDAGRRSIARTADETAVRALYLEHAAAMLGYATRLTRDREAAEDIVQEALIKAWQYSDKLVAERGSVRGWLFTVVRNQVIDRARAIEARPREVNMTAIDEHSAMTIPDHGEQVVAAALVNQLLAQLPDAHRDVLSETYLRGRNVAETADYLGIPPGTVRSRSYYALRSLRLHVDDVAQHGRHS